MTTTSKLTDKNRRVHAAKVLAESKRNKSNDPNAINIQYRIIRGDVKKLKRDLSHGYNLVKAWIETKVSKRSIKVK